MKENSVVSEVCYMWKTDERRVRVAAIAERYTVRVLDLEEELRVLIEAMDAAAVPYALCGGLAVAIHGHPRATIDIDLMVEERDVIRAREVVRTLGYRFDAKPMTFQDGAVPIHRASKIDTDGEVLMVDLLVVTPATVNAWDSRQTHEWSGRPLTVVSREGLIALKRLRSSPQDLADIAALRKRES